MLELNAHEKYIGIFKLYMQVCSYISAIQLWTLESFLRNSGELRISKLHRVFV